MANFESAHAKWLQGRQCDLASGEFGWGLLPALGCRGAGAIGYLEALGDGWGRAERWTRIHRDTGNLTWDECMAARHLELFVADEGDQCDSCGVMMADGHLFWGDTFRAGRWRYCCAGCASTGVTSASRKARFIARVLA